MDILWETLEQVLAATDIVELIGEYLPLEPEGANFKACCPFHNEETPSFVVNPARQSFHCFGCGEGGSAAGFVSRHEGIDLSDAVRMLARRAGISGIEDPDSGIERIEGHRERLLDLLARAAGYFHRQLLAEPDAKHARGFLKSRGFGGDVARRWQLGWMPGDPQVFRDWAAGEGFGDADLVEAALARWRDAENPQDGILLFLRNRLTFPIRDIRGEVIAFCGRQLRDDPHSGKYLLSPASDLFRKSDVLFALDRARPAIERDGRALLCDNLIDVIACHEAGIGHAVGCMFTSLTPEHARLLRRFASQVIVLCGGESCGIEAVRRAYFELAAYNIEVMVTTLPPGEDPDSLLRRDGPERFGELLAATKPFFDSMLDELAARKSFGEGDGRSAAARELASLVEDIVDRRARDAARRHVAARLRMGVLELEEVIATEHRHGGIRHRRGHDECAPPQVEPAPLDPTLVFLCHLALDSAEAKEWLAGQFETLREVGRFIAGMPVLNDLLARDYRPGNAATRLAVLDSLDPPTRRAIEKDTTFFESAPDAPLAAAQAALRRLTAKALQRRYWHLGHALENADDDPKHIMKVLAEIRDLLGGFHERYSSDDHPSEDPPENPADEEGVR